MPTRKGKRAKAGTSVAPAKMGRPTIRTPENAAAVCAKLAEGKSLRQIEKMEGMPSAASIYEWLAEDAEFSEQYARAREAQADALAEECLEIVDRSDLKADDKRVRFDARKWYASKLQPKKYGDATTIKGDAENPLPVKHEGLDPLEIYRAIKGKPLA